jgi:hypothetical protein
MPSVQEVLKQSGFSDADIAALDAKQVNAFTAVLTTAEQARERAEIERRSNAQFYDETIAPALNQWGSEKAQKDAELSFYRSQLESARASGFIPTDLDQPRDGQGRYVPNAPGSVPGSPTFVTQEDIDQRLGAGISNVTWMIQEYARAYDGAMIPDPIDKITMEAHNQRLPVRDFFARKYDLAGRQAAAQKKAQDEHDASIRREVEQRKDREWSERTGSNPDLRRAESSRYTEVARAVKAGSRPDPLSLNEAQRRAATSSAIRQEIAENIPPAA